MNVSLKCFGNLAKEGLCDYRAGMPHELADGAKVTDLVDKLGFRDEEIKLVYVNNIIVPKNSLLHEGDRVALAPPTGGM
jgi:sulfur carrier protein ThiS